MLLTLLVAAPVCSRGDAADDQFNFAEGLFIHRDYGSALEEYQTLLRQHPAAAKAPTALFRLGECHFRLEDYAKAATAFEAALAKHPKVKEAALGNYNLARSYVKLKDNKQAAAAFQKAIEIGNDEVREEAMIGRGECLIKLKTLGEAAELYAQFLKDFPKSKHRPEVLFSRGWTLANSNQHQAAVAPLTELIGKYPDFELAAKAKLALSDAYTALEQYEKSADILNLLLKGDRQGEEALLRLAWTMFKSGDKAGAAKTFVEFADKYSKSKQAPAALYNAGIAHYDRGQFPNAIAVFQRLLAEHAKTPEAAELLVWLGLSYFEEGQHQQAAAVLGKLVAGDKLDAQRRPSAVYAYAEALAAAGKSREALEWFQELIAKYPKSKYIENAWYSKGTTQEKAGDLAAATATLKEFLAKFPESRLRPHAVFALGEYLYRLGKKNDALPYLQELAKAKEPTAQVLYRLAWTHFELDATAESLQRFRQLAEQKTPFRHEALYMTGRAAEKLEQQPAAVAAYEALTGQPANDKFTEKAFFRLGHLYANDKAVPNLEAYLERFKGGEYGPALRLKVAENYFAQENVAQAKAHYLTLLKLKLTPDLASAAHYGLGWCLLKDGKPKEADEELAQVIIADLSNSIAADALLQRGEIAYSDGKFEVARSFFDKLKGLATARGERALYMLGWCARRQGAAADGVPHFQEQVKRFPKGEFFADASLRLAEGLNAKTDHAAARKALEAAAAKIPKALEEEHLQLYGDTLAALQDWEALIAASKTLKEQYPKSERAFLGSFRLGLAYKAVGLLDDAEKQFKDTIALTDTIEAAKAQFNIGSLYYTRKAYIDAAKYYLRVEMLYDYPELAPKALYYAVDAFLQAGEKNVARAGIYLKKLQEKHPDSEWTAKAQALVQKK